MDSFVRTIGLIDQNCLIIRQGNSVTVAQLEISKAEHLIEVFRYCCNTSFTQDIDIRIASVRGQDGVIRPTNFTMHFCA
jgi:hypothetical protein